MENMVLTVTGSIFNNKNESRDLENLIKNLSLIKNNYNLAISVGGGENARSYINLAKAVKIPQKDLDYIGIEITRINAEIIWRSLISESYTDTWRPPKSLEKAEKLFILDRFVCIGGTTPNQTTDTVAVNLCEKIGQNLIIKISNFSQVYTTDMKGNKTFHNEISYEDMIKEINKSLKSLKHIPGQNFPFDIIGLMEAKRMHCQIIIIKHSNLMHLFDNSFILKPIDDIAKSGKATLIR